MSPPYNGTKILRPLELRDHLLLSEPALFDLVLFSVTQQEVFEYPLLKHGLRSPAHDSLKGLPQLHYRSDIYIYIYIIKLYLIIYIYIY